MSHSQLTSDNSTEEGYLTGKLLVAMPNLQDSWFERTVIYICSHNAEGAMGLVLNKENDEVSGQEVAEQLNLPGQSQKNLGILRNGGPVEEQRGFVLHSTDYQQDTTIKVSEEFSLTATIDILKKISLDEGPKDFIVALGYAGWGAGQLDDEMQQNSWHSVDADTGLVFKTQINSLWAEAFGRLGISAAALSTDWGHA